MKQENPSKRISSPLRRVAFFPLQTGIFYCFSFLKNSIPIINIPTTVNRIETANKKVSPNSDTVVKNLPGGVDQPSTKLFPAINTIANVHILPINERKPPITDFFIFYTFANSILSASFTSLGFFRTKSINNHTVLTPPPPMLRKSFSLRKGRQVSPLPYHTICALTMFVSLVLPRGIPAVMTTVSPFFTTSSSCAVFTAISIRSSVFAASRTSAGITPQLSAS